jgi:hypothetical protein
VSTDFDQAATAAMANALGTPGDTIVLAIVGADGGLVMLKRGDRPRDVANIGRAVLEQARDDNQAALDARDGDSQGDDDDEELAQVLGEALDILDGELGEGDA